jgi:hypothetical protein
MSLTRFCTDVVSCRGHSRPVLGAAYNKVIGCMQGSEFNVWDPSSHIVLESRSCLKGRGRSHSTLFAARTSLDMEIAHCPWLRLRLSHCTQPSVFHRALVVVAVAAQEGA